MQENYTYEDHMAMVQVIKKSYYQQSEDKLGQTIEQF